METAVPHWLVSLKSPPIRHHPPSVAEYVSLYILCQPVHILCCSTASLHQSVYGCAQEAALRRCEGRGEGAEIEALKIDRRTG